MRTELGPLPLGARLGCLLLCITALALFACETRPPPGGAGVPSAQLPSPSAEPAEPSFDRGHLDSDERAAQVQESPTRVPDTPLPPRYGPVTPDSDAAALAGVSPEPGPSGVPSPPEPGRTPAMDSDEAATATHPSPTANEPAATPPVWTGRDG